MAVPGDTLIRKAAFARRIGVSAPRVSLLVKQELPVRDGMIPVAEGEAWVKANLNPANRAQGRKTSPPTRPDRLDQVPIAGEDIEEEVLEGLGLVDLKARHERVKIARAEVALARERGEVVAWSEVNAALGRWAQAERDSWLTWAQAQAPDIANELRVDAGLLLSVLSRHVSAHLHHLAMRPAHVG